MHYLRLLGLLGIGTMALTAGAVACGGDEGTGGTGGSGTGTGTGTGVGGSGTGVGGSGTGTGVGGSGTGTGMGCDGCTSPDPAHEEITYTVSGNVVGEVLDLNGQPAADIITDVCGTNLCLFGSADGNGAFSVPGNDSELVDVRILYGNGKRFAKMGARLPSCDQASCNGPQVGTINTIDLPDFGDGVELVAGSDVAQGDAMLSIPAESCFKHDLILYEEGELGFRSTVLAYDAASTLNLPAVDQANLGNDIVLVATAPINTVICPAAPMTVTLPAGNTWTDGTVVELYLHGTKTFQHYAPYGEWTKHGEGMVSGDTVVTNDGSEIEILGLYAIRPKP